jgi:hypothetical protein
MDTFCRVPIGFHYDYLSILGVKHDKTSNPKALEDYKQCCIDLRTQIGDEKFESMLHSNEYLELYEANSCLFDLVDAIKKDKSLGQALDAQVYVRWQKKKALQEKFYPESEYSEIKVGY